MPEPEIMDAEVGVALEDWEGIPTHEIAGVCTEARRRANGFPPPNSLVVDAWAELLERRSRERRDQEMYERSNQPPPRPLTPEEQANLDRMFADLRSRMGWQ